MLIIIVVNSGIVFWTKWPKWFDDCHDYIWAFHLITKNTRSVREREAQTKHIIRYSNSNARWKRRKSNNKRECYVYEYSFVAGIGGGRTAEYDGPPNIYSCSDWMLGFLRSIIYHYHRVLIAVSVWVRSARPSQNFGGIENIMFNSFRSILTGGR